MESFELIFFDVLYDGLNQSFFDWDNFEYT